MNRTRCAAWTFALAGFLFYAYTFAPISNVADAIHYHLGAHLAVRRVVDPAGFDREAARLERIGDELWTRGLDAHIPRNFRFACVTYAFTPIPVFALVDLLGPLRRSAGHPLYVWDVAALTIAWLGLLAILARLYAEGESDPHLAGAWFLSAGVFTGAVLLDAAPFLPLPRGLAVLFTSVAAALTARGGTPRAPALLLALAALSHPYQQAMNLVFFSVFLAFYLPTPWRLPLERRTWRLGLAAGIPVLLSFVLMNLLSHPDLLAAWRASPPSPPQDPAKLAIAWGAFRRTLRVGIALTAALWWLRGARSAALFAALWACLFGGVWYSRMPDMDLFLVRIGDAFLPPLYFLLLRENLFARLPGLPPRRAALCAAAALALLGAYYKGFQVPATRAIYPYSGAPPKMAEQTTTLLEYLERRP